jgi:hypothetical protein
VIITFGSPILPGELPQGAPEKERRKILLNLLQTALENLRDSGMNYNEEAIP